MTDPSAGADADAVADAVALTPQQAEVLKKVCRYLMETSSQGGGASSSNLFNVPEKNKKTPKKKEKKPNKKLEYTKKKAADMKAKLLKTVKEMNDLKLLAAIESKKKQIEMRKSLLQKDEEMLQKLEDKRNKSRTADEQTANIPSPVI